MKNNVLKTLVVGFLGVASISLAAASVTKATTNGASAYTPGTTYTNGDAATYYSSISDSLEGTSLLTALRTLNLSKRQKTVGYSSMGTTPSGAFAYTDYDPTTVAYDSNGQPYGTSILSFYSGISTTSWNREHVWPNSRGGGSGGSAGSPYPDADIHMPRPTINSENSNRGNSKYVEGLCHSSNGWDPVTAFADNIGVYESIRGECARIIFYCMTVNSNLVLDDTATGGTTGVTMGKISDLLKWNLENPVNSREINRNEGAEYLQGNRNAFIDHPEYACKIWGDTNSTTQSICSASTKTPTKITLSSSSTSIAVGETATISVTVDQGSKNVTWASSNTSVATVNNGVVTAVAAGTTTITATSTADTSVKGTITITVKTISSLSSSGTPTKTSYTAGESFDPTGLTVTARYSDSTTANVTSDVVWTPSPLTQGTTSVTGTYGGKTVTVSGLTVTAAQSFKIVFSDQSDGSAVLDSSTIISDYISEGADKVSSISDISRVYAGATGLKLGSGSGVGSFTINLASSVSVTGIKIKTKKYGSDSGNVTVTTDAGSGTATPTSTLAESTLAISGSFSSITIATTSKRAYISSIEFVTGSGSETVSVTGVTLDKSTLSLTTGATSQLTATVAPSNATDSSVSWKSSNTSVATVSSTGLVTAVAAGSATITVTTTDGSKTATCSVTVTAPTKTLSSISATGYTTSFTVGDTFSFGGTVTATYSDSSTSDVTSSATFSGYDMSSAGTQTVTVSYTYGSTTKTTTYSITVTSGSVTPPAGSTTVEMSTFSTISGDVNDDSNVSYEAQQGSAGTAPVVNTEQIRVYQNGGIFRVYSNNGCKITSITLGSAMATTVKYSVDGGTEVTNQSITAGGTLTVSSISADEVIFTCTGTSKTARLYVNYLSVTYESSGETPDYTSEASTWAIAFLAAIVCDQGATAPSTSNWSTQGTAYAALSSGAKALFVAATYSVSGAGSSTVVTAGDGVNENVASAVARYDYIIAKYGVTNYTNFMSRTINASNVINKPTTSVDSSLLITFVTIAATCTLLGCFFVYRKKYLIK